MQPWYPDEQAFAGSEHLDAIYVASYDRKAKFDPTDDITILQEAGLTSDSTIIDLGAGTGVFAIAASRFCHRVIAVDVSAAMTDQLRQRVEEAGRDNISVVQAGFLSYLHEEEPVDVVFTRNVLHQLPDFWKAIALQRMESFLRPGGILRLRDLIFDFDPSEADPSIEAWMAGATPDPSHGFTADELAQHVRTEFSSYSWLVDEMLTRVGFEILQRTFVRAAYGAYTCRKAS
jgi:ubiquinone/menaquinone biosynthesis C-methylase UbiE